MKAKKILIYILVIFVLFVTIFISLHYIPYNYSTIDNSFEATSYMRTLIKNETYRESPCYFCRDIFFAKEENNSYTVNWDCTFCKFNDCKSIIYHDTTIKTGCGEFNQETYFS